MRGTSEGRRPGTRNGSTKVSARRGSGTRLQAAGGVASRAIKSPRDFGAEQTLDPPKPSRSLQRPRSATYNNPGGLRHAYKRDEDRPCDTTWERDSGKSPVPPDFTEACSRPVRRLAPLGQVKSPRRSYRRGVLEACFGTHVAEYGFVMNDKLPGIIQFRTRAPVSIYSPRKIWFTSTKAVPAVGSR